MADMGFCMLVVLLGLTLSGIAPAPSEISVGDSIKYLQGGALLSYHVNISLCNSVFLPNTVPAQSWGGEISEVMLFDQGEGSFQITFGRTRSVTGNIYNITGRFLRVTEINLMSAVVTVYIDDINEAIPEYINGGKLKCDYKAVTLYERSKSGDELTTLNAIVSHLNLGYDINYVLNWDMCSPSNSTTGAWRAGRIADYRFSDSGDVLFNTLLNTSQQTFFMEARVSKSGVTVKTSILERVVRKQYATETRNCTLGQGYRVFIDKQK